MLIFEWLAYFPGGITALHGALLIFGTLMALWALPSALGRSIWFFLFWFVGMNVFFLWAPTEFHPRGNPIAALAVMHLPWLLYFTDLLSDGKAKKITLEISVRDWLKASSFRVFGIVFVLALVESELPPNFAAEAAVGELITGMGAICLWFFYKPESFWHKGLMLFWSAYGLTSALAMTGKYVLAHSEIPLQSMSPAIHWYFMDIPQVWALFFWTPLSIGIHLAIFITLYHNWKKPINFEGVPL